MTFSFVTPKHAASFLPAGAEALDVAHAIRKHEPTLRPSVLPSLLASRKLNQDVGNHGVRLFETASTWSRRGDDVVERNALALIADVDHTDGAAGAGAALRDMRGTIEELITMMGGDVAVSFEPAAVANMKTAAAVKIAGVEIGFLGLLDEKTRDGFDLQVHVAAAELDAEALIDCYPPAKRVGELPRFPGIERDLSVVVDESVPWADIESHVRATEPAMLESLRFLITYRGKPIPPGNKSVSFRMLFRDPSRTLRHEEVDPQVAQVVERLKREVGAELRG
jgi:phenylalanyl-tRNA synthetase beta chain